MLKLAFVVAFLVIGYIAYTGADVTEEYDSISTVRNQAMNEVVDPLTKKVLKQVSESELDQVIESKINEYTKESKNEM